ncbi:MAG TPA: insulinase family protein [Fimbriimonadaceae bacterium]|nr:insulinase family protein [Fimbriimonadaceae bacterium]
MLAVVLSLVLAPHQDEPPRLRTICRNGAVVMVERMAQEPTVSVQLWASSRSVPETRATHGWRHLVEHLIAKGVGRNLDARLESQGCTLQANTFRDAMQFQVDAPPAKLDLAIASVLEMLRPLETTEQEIKKEIQVMAEEFATYEDAVRLGSAAWTFAYGDAGLDPQGTVESLTNATPAALRDVQRKQFYPENLVLVISGPVDIKAATEKGVEAIGMRQGAIREAFEPRDVGKSGRVETTASGEGRAALVESFDTPSTVGALAFGLAVASQVEGGFLTYTPTLNRGLIIVGQTEKLSGMGIKIDEVTEADFPRLYETGKYLARSWVQRYLRTAQGVGFIRGLLLCQNAGSRPEQMLAAIDNLNYQQFREGAKAFEKANAVTVVGR